MFFFFILVLRQFCTIISSIVVEDECCDWLIGLFVATGKFLQPQGSILTQTLRHMNARVLPPPVNPASDGTWEPFDLSEQATAMAFNRSGTLLAVGGKAGRVAIWDFSTLCTTIRVFDPTLLTEECLDIQDSINTREDLTSLHTLSKVTTVTWTASSQVLLVGCQEGSPSSSSSSCSRLCLWDLSLSSPSSSGKSSFQRSYQFESPIVSLAAHPLNDALVVVSCLGLDPIFLHLTSHVMRIVSIEHLVLKYFHDRGQADVAEAIEHKTRTVSHLVLVYDEHPSSSSSSGGGGRRHERLFGASSKGYVVIVHSRTLEILASVSGLGVLSYPSLSLSHDSEYVLIPTNKGIRRFNTLDLAAYGPLELQTLFFAGGVRVGWSSCAYAGGLESRFVVGMPTAKHLAAGEKGLYVWHSTSEEVVTSIPTMASEGLRCIVAHPTRACVMALTVYGNVYQMEAHAKSSWAGRMYPVGYSLIQDNVVYDEPEDEFDARMSEDVEKEEENRGKKMPVDLFQPVIHDPPAHLNPPYDVVASIIPLHVHQERQHQLPLDLEREEDIDGIDELLSQAGRSIFRPVL